MENTSNLPDIPSSEEEYNPFSDPSSPWYRESGSFVPTRRNPLPARKCTAKTRKEKKPCGRWALAGSTVCYVHGGTLNNVKERAKAMQDVARLELMDSVPMALSTVYELAASKDTPHAVRLAASRDILDRNNIKGTNDININLNEGTAPSEKLFDKLASLRGEKPQELEDLGEVVEEDESEDKSE